jgi:hypothetical protein
MKTIALKAFEIYHIPLLKDHLSLHEIKVAQVFTSSGDQNLSSSAVSYPSLIRVFAWFSVKWRVVVKMSQNSTGGASSAIYIRVWLGY